MIPMVKSFVLLVASYAVHRSVTPPNPAPPSKERPSSSKSGPFVVPLFVVGQKTVVWSWAVTEAGAAFAASSFCPTILSQTITRLLVHGKQPDKALSQVSTFTPTFLFGIFLVLFGSLLRIYCFRLLGRLFTFELSIREGHKLVTSGPYSVVRHPSYTGFLMHNMGEALCIFNVDSWLVTCSGLFPPEGISGSQAWILRSLALLVGCGSMYARISSEEAMLQKNFGKQWKEWAERVPHKLIPGVW